MGNKEQIIDIKANFAERGALCVIEDFDIKRAFWVFNVPDKEIRGNHSHYNTTQILICVSGEIEVICDDGNNKRSYILNTPTKALKIPPLIWDSTIYKNQNSVLLVLADTKYDKNDYISSYEEFKKLTS